MRTFVGIPVPPFESLAQLRNRFETRLDEGQLKWTSPLQFHVTLVFLGEVAEGRIPDLVRSLDSARNGRMFSLELAGWGTFGPRDNPKILWAGVRKNAALKDLAAAVSVATKGFGEAQEERPYKPHLTLARIRRTPDLTLFKPDRDLSLGCFSVNEFVLYESRFSGGGSVYFPLSRFVLRSPS